MNLFTKSNNKYWERIVDLFVNYNDDLSSNINDTDTFKLVVLKSGSLNINYANKRLLLVAPAIIYLSNNIQLALESPSEFEAVTIYFKPTAIHDQFTYAILESNSIETMSGTTLYQDYTLIEKFMNTKSNELTYSPLTTSLLLSILDTINKMDSELFNQHDGYWPCRSRSYFLELLFFINYSCFDDSIVPTNSIDSDSLLGQIINYLNQHISVKILLEDITKQFLLNRNSLNRLFISKTNMTCLNYLLHMRIHLAKLMLSETELPICEIGYRVGFSDTNYFTKVFKRANQVTPSHYRKKS